MLEDGPPGATPVDEDEAEALIPSHIRTREELNAWEQANILGAVSWTRRTRAPALEEATIRELHHRLVWIHPFPNGNGRHARLWTDMFLRQSDRPGFEWKNAELDRVGEARKAYIRALRAADDGDYGLLGKLLLSDRPEA